MKNIKITTSFFVLFFLCINTYSYGQNIIKLEPYITYQVFKNFDDLANNGIIDDAVSPNGFEYTFGVNALYKNTGLKFETGHLKFDSKNQLAGSLDVIIDELPEIPSASDSNVLTSKGGTMRPGYTFTFKNRSVGLIQFVNFEKIRIGISGDYGFLTARKSANTGPLTPEKGINLYTANAITFNLERTDPRFFEYLGSRQYNNGNYLALGLEAGYEIFNNCYLFAAANYKNGHFKYRTDKQETSATSNWQSTDIEKLKFQTLGGKIGMLYSFGFDL